MEVDKQADTFSTQAHIGQKLRSDRINCLKAFDFHYYMIGDNQIDSIPQDLLAIVYNW